MLPVYRPGTGARMVQFRAVKNRSATEAYATATGYKHHPGQRAGGNQCRVWADARSVHASSGCPCSGVWIIEFRGGGRPTYVIFTAATRTSHWAAESQYDDTRGVVMELWASICLCWVVQLRAGDAVWQRT